MDCLLANDLALMAKTIKELKAQFICWKAAFEEKELKVNFGNAKFMECGGRKFG